MYYAAVDELSSTNNDGKRKRGVAVAVLVWWRGEISGSRSLNDWPPVPSFPLSTLFPILLTSTNERYAAVRGVPNLAGNSTPDIQFSSTRFEEFGKSEAGFALQRTHFAMTRDISE